MLQFDTTGELAFAHGTAAKGTNSLRLGNTWESIQYFEEVLDELDFGSERQRRSRKDLLGEGHGILRNQRVSIPVVKEYYDKGADKTLEEGGFGAETFTNPCIDFSYKLLPLSSGSRRPRSPGIARIVSEPLSAYNKGEISWFEKTYYEFGGPDSNAQELKTLKNILSAESVEQYDSDYLKMLVSELDKRHPTESSSILEGSGVM